MLLYGERNALPISHGPETWVISMTGPMSIGHIHSALHLLRTSSALYKQSLDSVRNPVSKTKEGSNSNGCPPDTHNTHREEEKWERERRENLGGGVAACHLSFIHSLW